MACECNSSPHSGGGCDMCNPQKTYCYDWCGNEQCDRNYIHTKEAIDNNIPVFFFIMKPMDCISWKDKIEHPNT